MTMPVKSRFVSGEWGNWNIGFREPQRTLEQSVNAGYNVSFMPDGSFNLNKNVGGVHTNLAEDLHAPTFEQGFGTNHLTIIAQGPRIAVYVNGEPLWFGYDESSSRGEIILGVCNIADTPLRVRFDNLKVWDITDLELPSAEGTPAPTGDATLYGCQPGESLLYHNDFEDGERSFGPWVAEEAPEGGLALHAVGQGMLSVLHESAPVAETRIAFRVRPVGDGSWTIFFRVIEAPGPKYSLTGFNDWLALSLATGDGNFPLASAGPLTPNRWALVEIVWEDRYTLVVRVDGAEVIRHVLPEDLLLERGDIHLHLGQTNSEAWFDDILVCGEEMAPSPSVEVTPAPTPMATPAPTGDATLYGCQPGESLLYHNDFEDGEPSFGPWVAEEAPEGGLALHAVREGMFNVLHESDPVTETRIAFRVRPVSDEEWVIHFRVIEPPGDKYNLTGWVDRLELALHMGGDASPLASAGPLTPNRWALVEISWESRYTLVVRIDGAEVIRHVLPEDLLLERGGIHLDQPRANSEAWFDDIVVCGE